MRVGVNVDAAGRVKPDALPHGTALIRTVLLEHQDTEALAAMHAADGALPVFVFARESVIGHPDQDSNTIDEGAFRHIIRTAMLAYAPRLTRLDAAGIPIIFQPGNEWDADPGSESSWSLVPWRQDVLIEYAVELYGTWATLWGPGCSSGIASRWLELARRKQVDAVCFHPYGTRPSGPDAPGPGGAPGGSLTSKIQAYRDVTGAEQQLVVSELGCKDSVGPGRDFAGDASMTRLLQAEWLRRSLVDLSVAKVDAAVVFCADDAMVPGFGLRTGGNAAKPAHVAVERFIGAPIAPPQPAELDPLSLTGVWGLRWRLRVPDAAYRHPWGIETEWRKNADAWGPPLTKDQVTYNYGGVLYQGRVFEHVGLVLWNEQQGRTFRVGWPT